MVKLKTKFKLKYYIKNKQTLCYIISRPLKVRPMHQTRISEDLILTLHQNLGHLLN